MNKRVKKTILLSLVTIGLWIISPSVQAQNAQIVDTGTVIDNIVFTDIKGNKVRLYDYLSQGYMVVLDLGLTTCTICWQYHNMGFLEILFRKYGPKGTVSPGKIMPVFIECNPATTRDDLYGKGANTLGDWVSGTSYPIVDLTEENRDATIGGFFKNAAPFPTPTFLIICPDGKLIYTHQGYSENFNEALLVKLLKGRCTAGGISTGTAEVLAEASVKVYPNPVSDIVYIESEKTVNISIVNIAGKVIREIQDAENISLSGLAEGIYLLRITDKDGHVMKTTKLLKQ